MEEIALRIAVAVVVVALIGLSWRFEGNVRSAASQAKNTFIRPRRHHAATAVRVARKSDRR
jgi:hypothetical protein